MPFSVKHYILIHLLITLNIYMCYKKQIKPANTTY